MLRTGFGALPVPAEEARLGGVRHSRKRDAAAIAHHYDVSNAFYRIVLGPSMTYSCAVWERGDVTLEDAQAAKYELVSRKLGLEPGMRLLDVGCGWGGMVVHAAANHGVRAVGVTLSRRQAEWAEKAVAEAGLADRVEIRYQDYRDVRDGPFDAISSIGMFEHVGLSQLRVYFGGLRRLLRPGGRLLNHGIARPPNAGRTRFQPNSFIDRYVFPDGELHELGSVVSTMQGTGFEVRHVESLREHYALTLRAWVRNLEDELGRGRRRGGPGPGARLAPVHGGLGAQLRGRPDAGPPGPGGAIRRRPLRAAAPTEVRGAPAAALTAPRYRRPVHSRREGRCRDRSSSSATTP